MDNEEVKDCINKIKADCRLHTIWKTEHDARINQYWESQWKLNVLIETRINQLSEELKIVSTKQKTQVAFAAGMGAVIGSGVFALLIKVFLS